MSRSARLILPSDDNGEDTPLSPQAVRTSHPEQACAKDCQALVEDSEGENRPQGSRKTTRMLSLSVVLLIGMTAGAVLLGQKRNAITASAHDASSLVILIKGDSIVPVKKECMVFNGDWHPIDQVSEHWQVTASGPLSQQGEMTMLPIKAATAPDGTSKALVGTVQIECLVLPGDDGIPPLPQAEQQAHEPTVSDTGAFPQSPQLLHQSSPSQPGDAFQPGLNIPNAPKPPLVPRAEPQELQELACADKHYADGWVICQNTYCGQDKTSDAGTMSVQTDEACAQMCDQDPHCIGYEIYGHNAKECTLRPVCDNLSPSRIGTRLALKAASACTTLGACQSLSGDSHAGGNDVPLREAMVLNPPPIHSHVGGSDVPPTTGAAVARAPDPAPAHPHVGGSDIPPPIRAHVGGSDPPVPAPNPPPAQPHVGGSDIPPSVPAPNPPPAHPHVGGSDIPPSVPAPNPSPARSHVGGSDIPPSVPAPQPSPAQPHIGGSDIPPPIRSHVGGSDIPPSVLPPKPPTEHKCGQRTQLLPGEFDCTEGFKNWVLGWSDEKQEFCCSTCGIACEVPTQTTSATTMQTWRVSTDATTTVEVLTTSTLTTTVTTEFIPFDCDEGDLNVAAGWSVWKKRWCCSVKNKGCEPKGTIRGHCNLDNVVLSKLEAHPTLDKLMWQALKSRMMKILNVGGSSVGLRDIIFTYFKEDPTNMLFNFDIKLPAVREFRARKNLFPDTLATNLTAQLSSMAHTNKLSAKGLSLEITRCNILPSASRIPCECDDGVPAGEDTCDGSGGTQCQSCHFGFTLTKARLCEANICKCIHGIAAVGGGCHDTGANVCGFCQHGYKLVKTPGGKGYTCEPTTCTCQNGWAVKGSACVVDGTAACSKCDKGYHKDTATQQCVSNECHCENGDAPVTGSPTCDHHDKEVCVSCRLGFHVDPVKNICVENKCYCDSGNAAVGTACLSHDAEICVSCEGDSYLSALGKCGYKKCTCPNGKPVDGDQCTTNRGKICQSCDPEFYMYLEQCVPKSCACPGGKTIANCSAASDSPCESCMDGFHIHKGKCRRNKCTCTNGDAAKWKNCLHDQLEVCSNCDDGFHMLVGNDITTKHDRITIRCKPNTCKCKFGTPAGPFSNPVCNADKKEMCTTCDDGYTMGEDHVCRVKHCTCKNGVGTRFNDCAVHGTENCQECVAGFHVTERGAMLKNTKICVKDGTFKDPFTCGAGVSNRMLGWSVLKKDWCCKNKGIACMVANQTGSEACSPDFTEEECDQVGCCAYDGSVCRSAVGDQVCRATRTLQLRGSPNFCLAAFVDSTTGMTKCVTNDLTSSDRLSWIYSRADNSLMNKDGKVCLELVNIGGSVSFAVGSNDLWVNAKTAACTGKKSQKWTVVDNARLQITFVHPRGHKTKLSWCLGVQSGQLETPGALAVVRPCKKEKEEGQDWNIPAAVFTPSGSS